MAVWNTIYWYVYFHYCASQNLNQHFCKDSSFFKYNQVVGRAKTCSKPVRETAVVILLPYITSSCNSAFHYISLGCDCTIVKERHYSLMSDTLKRQSWICYVKNLPIRPNIIYLYIFCFYFYSRVNMITISYKNLKIDI